MLNPNQILEAVLKKGVDQAEVYLSSSKTTKVSVLNGKVESSDEIANAGMGIRIIKDKKQGFAYTSDLDEFVKDFTISKAIENAKNSEADEYLSLPEKSEDQTIKPSDLYDPEISKTPIEKKIELALKIESSAYKADKRVKKTEKVSYTDSEAEVWIVNSNGINAK